MSRMEIAVQVMDPYSHTLEVARLAEAQGLAALAVADHYLTGWDEDPVVDQLTVLAAVATQVRLPLVTLVSPITFRHPAVMLKTALALDEIADGRFSLGVGTGWMEQEHQVFGFDFPPLGERFARLEEALGYLRAGLQGVGYQGDFYRLDPAGAKPQPKHLELVVGGSGTRRTPQLAGRYADEFNAFPSRDPFAPRIEAAHRAADAAGRTLRRVSTAFPPLVGRTREEFEQALTARVATRGDDPQALLERFDTLGIPHGTPEDVAEGLRRLQQAGIERVYLQVARTPLEVVSSAIEVFVQASA